MTWQQWSSYVVSRAVEIRRKKTERLRRIPKAMQEENSSRIPLLQIDCLSAANYFGLWFESHPAC